ncbi:MAG TPA: recombinase family protein [Alphaproteobacteria bacterium]|nr:recombinase family protein [Alphaproteobacteria bacterium]
MAPVLDDIRAEGHTSYRAVAHELNRRGILTARGGRWYAATVRNLVRRLRADVFNGERYGQHQAGQNPL